MTPSCVMRIRQRSSRQASFTILPNLLVGQIRNLTAISAIGILGDADLYKQIVENTLESRSVIRS